MKLDKTPVTLSTIARGRDNNFNFIRVCAAYAVLFTHSFSITTGSSDAEPLVGVFGMTIGTMAVDVFFITSGFLVTTSLMTRQSVLEFAAARALRIFPALFLMLCLTVFGIGLYFTSLPAATYLTDHEVHRYFIKNLILFRGTVHELPGVFETNPFKSEFNTPLWTLPYEIKMYALLAIGWVAFTIVPRMRTALLGKTIIIMMIATGIFSVLQRIQLIGGDGTFTRLAFMFFAGATFYIIREKIILAPKIFLPLIGCMLVSLLNKDVFYYAYMLVLTYTILYLAHIPAGRLRNYNRLGDYSYGIYIYSFPIQQSLAALFPGISTPEMVVGSTLATFTTAILSWHFLEKYALQLKPRHAAESNRQQTQVTHWH